MGSHDGDRRELLPATKLFHIDPNGCEEESASVEIFRKGSNKNKAQKLNH